MHREDDGGVHFWRIEENLQNQFPESPHWSDDRWKAYLTAGGKAKRRYQYCTDFSEIIVYFRALQGKSRHNLINPSLQDNVIFRAISSSTYSMSDVLSICILSSVRDLFLESKFEWQTNSIFSVYGLHGHKPWGSWYDRLEWLHKAWKKHQNTIYWVDINVVISKRLKFCQTRPNAIVLQKTLPVYCIPKVNRMETVEVLSEIVCMSSRIPSKISLKN